MCRNSVSFFLDFGFSFCSIYGDSDGELLISAYGSRDSVFGSISFEEVFSLEYLFPQNHLIEVICQLESVKTVHNVLERGVNYIDVVLDVVDDLKYLLELPFRRRDYGRILRLLGALYVRFLSRYRKRRPCSV